MCISTHIRISESVSSRYRSPKSTIVRAVEDIPTWYVDQALIVFLSGEFTPDHSVPPEPWCDEPVLSVCFWIFCVCCSFLINHQIGALAGLCSCGDPSHGCNCYYWYILLFIPPSLSLSLTPSLPYLSPPSPPPPPPPPHCPYILLLLCPHCSHTTHSPRLFFVFIVFRII